MEDYAFNPTSEEAGVRLDVFLAGKIPSLSRSHIQNIIKEKLVKVDGRPVKSNHRVKEGEHISVSVPPPRAITIEPENILIDIIYEDKDIIVINKSQGMVVHPAVGNYSGTLVNALLFRCKELSGINGEIRPGIVHRIDKDTSGLLVVAKNDMAHRDLAMQIKAKTPTRIYRAIVHKNVKTDKGTVCAPIGRHPSERKKMAVIAGGREAVTHYTVLERFGDYTYIEARLETGRTHQIRVHMAYIGHPLVGDKVYGVKKEKFQLAGQTLHAAQLALKHPRTGEYMEFNAPLPEYFENLLMLLRKNKPPTWA
jgi:23S rRNA pseudouridine1911/1915/1917 synthase